MMAQVREVVSAVVRRVLFLSTAKRKVIGRKRRLQWRPHHHPLEIGRINRNGYTDPDSFWRKRGEVRELQEALEWSACRRSEEHSNATMYSLGL
jgi:hypothetical protein